MRRWAEKEGISSLAGAFLVIVPISLQGCVYSSFLYLASTSVIISRQVFDWFGRQDVILAYISVMTFNADQVFSKCSPFVLWRPSLYNFFKS